MRIEIQARQQRTAKNSIPRRIGWAVLLCLMAVVPAGSWGQVQRDMRPTASELTPEPAVPAILAAFDKYEVVGMSEGHGMKDVDDFILSLIRNPAFSDKVNDIEVECAATRCTSQLWTVI
jgi:hypothetical protein